MCFSLFSSASKSEPQSPAELPSAPALAQVWQVALGVRGRPAHLGATPGVPPPARGPTAELWETRARRERPDRPAPRVHAARTRRAHGAPRHVSRRAARASSGAQSGASHGAQSGASHGAQTGSSYGAQNGASFGAQDRASFGAQSGVFHGTRIACLTFFWRNVREACLCCFGTDEGGP